MKNYHIGRDGTPRVCPAQIKCTLGGLHGTLEQVQQEIDRINAEHHGFITTLDEAGKMDDRVARRVMRGALKVAAEDSTATKAVEEISELRKSIRQIAIEAGGGTYDANSGAKKSIRQIAIEAGGGTYDAKYDFDNYDRWDPNQQLNNFTARLNEEKAEEIREQAKADYSELALSFFKRKKYEPMIIGIGRKFAANIKSKQEAKEFYDAHFNKEELKQQKKDARMINLTNKAYRIFDSAALGVTVSNPISAFATIPVSLFAKKIYNRVSNKQIESYSKKLHERMEKNKDNIQKSASEYINPTAHITARERNSVKYEDYTMTPNEVREYARDFLKEKYGLELSVPIHTNGNMNFKEKSKTHAIVQNYYKTKGSSEYRSNVNKHIPIKMEFSEKFIANANEDTIKSVIRHEATHYAMARKGLTGQEITSGSSRFERELRKNNATSSQEHIDSIFKDNVDEELLRVKTDKGYVINTGHRLTREESRANKAKREQRKRMNRSAEVQEMPTRRTRLART